MIAPHVGRADEQLVPVKTRVTATSNNEHATLVTDGDPNTAWCQIDEGGHLLLTLKKVIHRAHVVVHFDESASFEIEGSGTEVHSGKADQGGDVAVDLYGDLTWIRIQPHAAGTHGNVCVRDVELHEWTPVAKPVSTKKPVTVRAGAQEIVTNDALSRAPDMVRALRLGLEDCDVATMKAWVSYPLHADDTTYDSAAAEREACLHGDAQAVAPTIADLNAALSNMTASGDQITLAIGDRVWRLRWRKGQWWLTGVE
jgi:hypothetical protein